MKWLSAHSIVPCQPTWRHEMQRAFEMRHVSRQRNAETTTQRVDGQGNPGAAVQGGFEDATTSSIASVETSVAVEVDRRAGIAAAEQRRADTVNRKTRAGLPPGPAVDPSFRRAM
ncbi:hypothetical protein DL769_001372 [Monosporascus sp. CRB-8-3]|nr:hypothetical protein DL769_001372 [Monosporascus sp. CRB-8-3]